MTPPPATDGTGDRASRGPRAIGPAGTAGRVVLGGVLLGAVAWGELRASRPSGLGLLFGLVVLPGLMLAWQWLRARRNPARLQATGPAGTAINLLAGVGLFLTGFVVPALWFTSDGLLAFYGASMLLAAVRGYGGCEVLAFSNWVLGRDDQVGCFVFSPIDNLERRLRSGLAS